jgi:AraC-like DNA-binding protein
LSFISRVASHTLTPLFACAERAGVSRAELLAAADLRDEPLPEELVYDQVTLLWQHAARLTADPAFGIHAAENAHRGVFDVLEYAALSSVTLGDALSRLCRYQRLLTEVATYTLAGSTLRLELRLGANRLPPSRHAVEYLLACVVDKSRRAASGARPAAVRFRHAAPATTSEHDRVFGCVVEFEADRDELELSPATLAIALEHADPVLRSILDRHASALLDQLPETDLFSARVHRWLREHLADQPTLASAARQFRLSERGFQRRLETERETFEALLDRTRRHEATRLLADRRLAVAEVATALGFSESSAFHRAFKRWNGVTPSAWRKRMA